MFRFMLPVCSLLIACTPSPQKAAMPNPASSKKTSQQIPSDLPTDSPAEAFGRKILSAAFVRVGPDGHLTVELRDGRALVLRDVTMRPHDYCGVQVADGGKVTKYCGGYADLAAARPGSSGTNRRNPIGPNTVEPAPDAALQQ